MGVTDGNDGGPASDMGARPGRVTALCGAVQGVGGGLGWSVLPPMMPAMVGELHLSHTMGGLVWGAAPLGIALAAPLGGTLVDRFGPRRVVTIALLVGALACAARAWCQDGPSLMIAMLVFGMHIGFVAPALPKALAGHVPGERLARASGATLVSYTFGTALTILLARTVLAPAAGGWRPLMIAAGIAMAVVAAAWQLGMRDRGALSGHARLRDVLDMARHRELLRVAAMQFLMFGGYLALLGLLPRLLAEAGLQASQIGRAVALWLAVAGTANLLGPMLSDRIGRRRPLLLGGAAVATLGLAAVAALGIAQGGLGVTMAWLGLAALGGGSFAPLLLALPLELPGIGAKRAGAAMGLLMLVGQVGGFVLPVAAGKCAESGGFVAALGMLAAAHALVILPALGLRETGRAARHPPDAADANSPAAIAKVA